MENFDVTVDYYALLGVPFDADDRVIITSYLTSQSGKSGEELSAINKAFAILTNSETRKAYDKARAEYLAGLRTSNGARVEEPARTAEHVRTAPVQGAIPAEGTVSEAAPRRRRANNAQRVVAQENGQQQAKKGNKVVKGIGITALILLLLLAAGAVGHRLATRNIQNNNNTNRTNIEQPVNQEPVNQGDPIGLLDVVGTPTATPAPTEEPFFGLIGDNSTVVTPEPTAVVQGEMSQVRSFGNALDDAQVTERAQRLLAYADSIGAYNINTGLKFTLEDMKNMVLYLNGAYVPTSDANAFRMEDDFLAFACIPLNDPRIVRGVSFANNCPTDGSYIADPVNFTDMILMGDSYCYPYLLWLQNEWNIITTSDSVEVRRTETSKVMQSYADIMFGTGFNCPTQDGKTILITHQDLASRQRINDGNIFRLYGLIIPIFSSDVTQQEFVVNGIDGPATVGVSELLEQLNVRCAEDIAKDVQYDNSGRVILPVNEGLDNLYDRIQTNSVSAATDNLYFGNTSAYEETQRLSLGK